MYLNFMLNTTINGEDEVFHSDGKAATTVALAREDGVHIIGDDCEGARII